MIENRGDVRVFRYPLRFVLGLSAVPVGLIALLLSIVVIDCIIKHYYSAIFFLIVSSFMMYFAPGLVLSTAVIKVGDFGLSAYWCGLCTQHYRWDSIVRIRKAKLIEMANRNKEYIDVIKDARGDKLAIKNIGGVIRFTDYIDGYADLVSIVNQYAKAHSIDRRCVDEGAVKAISSPEERAKLASLGMAVDEL